MWSFVDISAVIDYHLRCISRRSLKPILNQEAEAASGILLVALCPDSGYMDTRERRRSNSVRCEPMGHQIVTFVTRCIIKS
jgi:hypothetical protein